jgi:hypothetical protein
MSNAAVLKKIASASSAGNQVDDENEGHEDEEIEGNELTPVPTVLEAVGHIETVRHFLLSRNTPQIILNRLAEVELHINEINLTRKIIPSSVVVL